MKYLILICISFLLSCGYEHSYQASIDKQGGVHEEVCNLRDWVIECMRDAYSVDDISDCDDVFGKRHHDIAFRNNTYVLSPSVTPQHASDQHLSISARADRCIENVQSFYDIKRCWIRFNEDMKKYSGC